MHMNREPGRPAATIAPLALPSVNPRALEDMEPKAGVALCLSGGGYGGMLFNLGSLWRLNELGSLRNIDQISSVSAAAITAGTLAAAWDRLDFDEAGVGRRFVQEVVEPIRRLACETVDVWSIAGAELSQCATGDIVANAYDECLYGGTMLSQLPDYESGRSPQFVFTALNVHSSALVAFSRTCIFDPRVGRIERPNLRLALAIAAATAFSPMMPPVTLRFTELDYTQGTGSDLQRPPFTTRPAFIDAGVCDSLALESASARYRTLLISDGNVRVAPNPELGSDWFAVATHVLQMLGWRDRERRAQRLEDAFASSHDRYQEWRAGAHWSPGVELLYGCAPDALPYSADQSEPQIGETTRFEAMSDRRQEQWVNWGYAACDAGMSNQLVACNS